MVARKGREGKLGTGLFLKLQRSVSENGSIRDLTATITTGIKEVMD